MLATDSKSFRKQVAGTPDVLPNAHVQAGCSLERSHPLGAASQPICWHAPEPTPCCGQPSSTDTTRCVLRTEAAIASRSMGFRLRRGVGGEVGGATEHAHGATLRCAADAASNQPKEAIKLPSPPGLSQTPHTCAG